MAGRAGAGLRTTEALLRDLLVFISSSPSIAWTTRLWGQTFTTPTEPLEQIRKPVSGRAFAHKPLGCWQSLMVFHYVERFDKRKDLCAGFAFAWSTTLETEFQRVSSNVQNFEFLTSSLENWSSNLESLWWLGLGIENHVLTPLKFLMACLTCALESFIHSQCLCYF